MSLTSDSSLAVLVHARATSDVSPLSLHDALPIYAAVLAPAIEQHRDRVARSQMICFGERFADEQFTTSAGREPRSEEHTSELQSLTNLVCRLLLEKKKQIYIITHLQIHASLID